VIVATRAADLAAAAATSAAAAVSNGASRQRSSEVNPYDKPFM